jgi:hypothetical protein
MEIVMRKLAWGSLLVLVVAGCGGRPAKWGRAKGGADAKAQPAPAPKLDANALMEREVPGQYPTHDLNLLGGTFTGPLQATAPPVVQSGQTSEGVKVDTLTFRIGSTSPMVCYVRGTRDPASLVDAKIDEIKKAMAKNNVQGHLQNPDVAVEIEGSHPVLYLDVPVVIGAQQRPGLIKLAFSPRDGGSVLCMHDELGYRKTFRRIAGGLVANATVTGDYPQPVYTEIGVAKIEGKTAGYTESYEYVQDGQVKTLDVLALVRGDKGASHVVDRVERTTANAKGELLSLQRASGGFRDTVTALDLKRGKAGNDYVYEGTVQKTKVKGSFTAPRPLESRAMLAARMLQVASGKLKELKYLGYDERQRLEGPIEIVVTREDPKTLTMKSDTGDVWQTSIDALGLAERTMFPRDKNGERLIIERAYSQGQPSATVSKKPAL